LRVTSAGVSLIAATVLAIAYSIASMNPLFYLLSLSLAFTILYEYALFKNVSSAARSIRVNRRASSRSITELEVVELGVDLANNSPRNLPRILVHDEAPGYVATEVEPLFTTTLPAYSTVKVSYRAKALAPGRIDFTTASITLMDPLALFRSDIVAESRESIVVLPLYTRVDETLRSIERLVGIYTRGRSHSGEYDLANIREYTPGDDVRKILWKQYAKTGELLVREDYGEVRPLVLLVVDTRRELWSIGSGVNTLGHVQLRLARSLLESLSTTGATVDLVMCTSQSPKIYRDAGRSPVEALHALLSTLEAGGGCEVPLSTATSIIQAHQYGGGSYDAVIIISNPVSVAGDAGSLREFSLLYPGRVVVIAPRFNYESIGLRVDDVQELARRLMNEAGVWLLFSEEGFEVEA